MFLTNRILKLVEVQQKQIDWLKQKLDALADYQDLYFEHQYFTESDKWNLKKKSELTDIWGY